MIRCRTKILLSLMALLGMSACADEPDMYGCPPSEYNDSMTGETYETANQNNILPLENKK